MTKNIMDNELKIYKPKVAVVSDIHAGLHQNSQAWYDILLQWAEWFKQECLDHNIKDIIIPGDIFHNRNEINVHTLHKIYEMFKMFDCFNIIGLVGNHDAYYKNKSDVNSIAMLNEWENISIVDEVSTFTAFDRTITICPWGTEMSEIPTSDVIFGHFELQGFKYAQHKVCTHGMSSREMLKKGDLVITGHFHSRDERKYDNGEIVYVGCAFQQNWSDCGSDKGYYLLDLDDLSYEFYENTVSPKHIKINLSDIIRNGIDKDKFQGNWIKLNLDVPLSHEKIDKMIDKLNTLLPLSLHIDYPDTEQQYEIEDYEFTSVDIGSSIREYVELLDINNKIEVTDCVLDLYKRVTS